MQPIASIFARSQLSDWSVSFCSRCSLLRSSFLESIDPMTVETNLGSKDIGGTNLSRFIAIPHILGPTKTLTFGYNLSGADIGGTNLSKFLRVSPSRGYQCTLKDYMVFQGFFGSYGGEIC